VKKGGQYVKPFIDDTPYLLFKRMKDAQATLVMDRKSMYKIVKVRVTIEPIQGF
jgi:nitrogenase molybdenum-iron protein alpha/beta subunit